ncbi:MAG: ribosome silencing factor [Oscillospiraceae bacterium]|nr:ribosome silencing factor [Oscillospiraceae bacterium]
MAESLELVSAIVKAIDSKRGMKIEVLKTSDVTILADYFVLATASSTTQLKTLSDVAEEAAEKLGETPYSVEGERESGWRVLDYSTVIVHIFLPDQRNFYNLERLWQDAEVVDVAPMLAVEDDE